MKEIHDIADATDFAATVQGEVPVLVDFWAPWCGPCLSVAPALAELAGELAGRVRIAKVNVDDHPEIAGRFAVRGIPTMILFAGGRELDRVSGAAPKQALRQWLESRAA